MAVQGATGVVERLIAASEASSRDATWVDVGLASVRDDGWAVLEAGDRPALLDPVFAGEQGPGREQGYAVDELRREDGVLLLRTPRDLPEHSLHVWARSPQLRLQELIDGLRAAEPAPLAQALAEERLAGAPTSRAEAPGLDGAQLDVVRACLSDGLRVVWGAPGAVRTQVLTRAVEELVHQGKRVLLVSTNDAAVDAALQAVVRSLSPSTGLAIRVGGAPDPDVQLEWLVARATQEVDGQRAAVAAQLRELDETGEEIERLRVELTSFDEPTYRAAAARLARTSDLGASAADELTARLQEAEAHANTVRRAAVAAARQLQEALAANLELDRVREALEHERAAVDGLAVLEHRHRALRAERSALEAQEPPSGWGARKRHRRAVRAADAELRRFAEAAAAGRRRWLDAQLAARAVIGERTRADVVAAEVRVARAEAAVAAADQEYRSSRAVLAELRTALAGVASEEDRALVADADARELPAKLARLRELDARHRVAAPRRPYVEAEQHALVRRARVLRANAEARIVREARVVAATLAQARTHPLLARTAFDVVLVDGAGGATLAEVLLALRRATTTAVLFGDDSETVLDDAAGQDGSDVHRWVYGRCFSHLGIRSAADAAGRDGCVVLPPIAKQWPVPAPARSG